MGKPTFSREWYESLIQKQGTHRPGDPPQDAKLERDCIHEHVAKDEGKDTGSKRRLVRYTSYRVRLCDERNLCDKHFTDALVRAGILVDDSPSWCKIEVTQEKVNHRSEERTMVAIIDLVQYPEATSGTSDTSQPAP